MVQSKIPLLLRIKLIHSFLWFQIHEMLLWDTIQELPLLFDSIFIKRQERKAGAQRSAWLVCTQNNQNEKHLFSSWEWLEVQVRHIRLLFLIESLVRSHSIPLAIALCSWQALRPTTVDALRRRLPNIWWYPWKRQSETLVDSAPLLSLVVGVHGPQIHNHTISEPWY